jgi:Bacterial PH domain
MDIEFPITLRASAGRKSSALAIGAFFVVCGFFLIGAQGTTRVAFFGQVPKHDMGYFIFFLGILIVACVVRVIASGHPALVLNADGLVYTPLFGAPRRVSWAEIAELTFESDRYQGCVKIRTRAGKHVEIPAFQGSADDMCILIRRGAVAAGNTGIPGD